MNDYNTINPGTPELPSGFKTIKRDGSAVLFDPTKVEAAIGKALLAANKQLSSGMPALARQLAKQAISSLAQRRGAAGCASVEDIQDHAELALMRAGEHDAAKAYVLYREQRSQLRRQEQQLSPPTVSPMEQVKQRLLSKAQQACRGLSETQPELIVEDALKNLYVGASKDEEIKALLLSTRTLIEQEPSYSQACARILLAQTAEICWGKADLDPVLAYPEYFEAYIHRAISVEIMDPQLAKFDLHRLAQALNPQSDMGFDYLGMQTIVDRYLLNEDGVVFEMPQYFFMRVAMGMSLREIDREAKAIEFYQLLSSFDFMSSTPTLFNSGTLHSQLSSCYLTTIPDDLDGIYEGLKENALLQKYAGGIGNDWTPVRALGSHIKGTNGKSQGSIPFMKVANDTAVAVNQGGKRKGAVCGYLETWHLDIEEFLELRKNTGDDRRRTHDMNTANWIPDLFMNRVFEGGEWTLFSPSDAPQLHDLWGKKFNAEYLRLESLFDQGVIKHAKRIPALQLWRKMLSMLFETGHPWINFKDPCNIRSPQRHAGVVHSSNLCTEITLNTSKEETAVCNLGSVNLFNHLKRDDSGALILDRAKIQKTVKTAMRMLDNVIDINFYGTKKARTSNLRHRPVGLGMMGFQDCLIAMGIAYASDEAMVFADQSTEMVCYAAYEASSDLALERGRYSSYEGSLWSQGILPQDSLDLLLEERGGYVNVDRSSSLDWAPLRAKIAKQGMRNSNCVAIAPTATISNIIGVEPCIEPIYQTLFVKSNMSGEFTIINKALVDRLKTLNLWDPLMTMDLKHFDGDLDFIDRVPPDVKKLFATSFKIEPSWLIEAASRRQKWIDQAQSLNLYLSAPSGKKIDDIYRTAWIKGLKTTYYLRTKSASSTEKSTGRAGTLNAVSGRAPAPAPAPAQTPYIDPTPATDVKFCSIDNPDCEACQ